MATERNTLYLAALLHNLDKVWNKANGDRSNTFPNPATVSDWHQSIIKKAETYASGEISSEGHQAHDGKLSSIFEGVDPDHSGETAYRPDYRKRLDALAIEFSDSYFPVGEGNVQPEHQALWDQFLVEHQFADTAIFRSYAETLLSLLAKYSSRIPGSARLPDVSLYDHAKTRAAFAVALYDYMTATDSPALPGAADLPFALIGGDVSGIQKFIYGIIARGAAKNLKGRSFYLQLLVDTIVRSILDELDLYNASVVYASGGSFYILTANTPDLPAKIAGIERNITGRLLEYHGTDLYLALDHVAFGAQELFHTPAAERTIGRLWQELSEKLGAKKSQRFKAALQGGYDKFFEPENEGGNTLGRDAITGEDLRSDFREIEEGLKVNAYTYRQIELGKALRSADYWVQSRQKLSYLSKKEPFEPIGLGYYHYFIDKDTYDQSRAQFNDSTAEVRVLFLNKGKALAPIQHPISHAYGFAFYGGNDYPVSPWHGSPKTFEEIAGIAFGDDKKEKRTSAPNLVRLGILRMDVDRLGSIFQRGFAPDRQTFSRYTTLSRSLDYFFKGYLNRIWAENDEYRQYTQIIYSGGDDLFIVGKWDVLARMAVNINRRFRDWVCHSPAFTLSGGLAIVGPKYPLLKAATLAETFEKQAKDHSFGGVPKNAFSIFGYAYAQNGQMQDLLFAFDWDNELPFVLGLKDTISGLLSSGLSQGFPSEAYNLMQQADFRLKDGRFEVHNFEVIWLAAYNFKRAAQANASPEVKEFLREWTTNLMTHRIRDRPALDPSKYHPLQYLALAARWAALEKRSEL